MNARVVLTLAPFAGLLFILPFPSTVAFRLLCLAAAFAVAMFRWRKLSPPSIPAKPVLLAWAAIALVSVAYAVDPAYSLGEIKNELGYTMMAFIAFFAITGTVQQLRLWARVVVTGAAVISVWAMTGYFRTGIWEEGGRHGGTGAFASLAVAAAPMLLIAWRGLSARACLLLACMAIAILTAAILCQQRILWVAFGLQFVILVFLLRKTGFLKISRRVLVAVAVGGLAVSAVLLLTVHASRTESHAPELKALDKDIRLAHWQRVFARIQEHPVIGSGFGRESMKEAHPDLIPSPESPLWHPHNVFLTYGIAMGWPGMLVLLTVFFSLLRIYWKNLGAADADRRLAAIVGIALVLGVVTRNLTNDFFLRDGALMFWALNGGLLGYLSRQPTMSGTAGGAV